MIAVGGWRPAHCAIHQMIHLCMMLCDDGDDADIDDSGGWQDPWALCNTSMTHLCMIVSLNLCMIV